MINDITELNIPDGVTLSQATATMQDMGEKSISATIKISSDTSSIFSSDWEIEFKGERYIMPTRKPQASKDNENTPTLDVTFQHWAIYQLKRWFFFSITEYEADTVVPDKYDCPISLNLKDFITLFNKVLQYYFDDKIKIDLNPDWEYDEEPTTIEITNSFLWDILVKFYETYGARWQIVTRLQIRNEELASKGQPLVDGNSQAGKELKEQYVIRVGYALPEINHTFEHGFKGGLLKIERQVQDEKIVNMLIGRGGEKNLPYRYFKEHGTDNDSFSPDPDWIPELKNVYFNALHGATFRSYIQGWNHNRYKRTSVTSADKAYAPWAWMRGYTDTKFNPIEFVADEFGTDDNGYRAVENSSIAKYGELMGGLSANEDIYPTIQGVDSVNHPLFFKQDIGRVDQMVDFEIPEETDEDDVSNSYQTSLPELTGWANAVRPGETTSISMSGRISVPAGMYANLLISTELSKVEYANKIPLRPGLSQSVADLLEVAEIVKTTVRLVKDGSSEEISASGIPEGEYNYIVTVQVRNKKDEAIDISVKTLNSKLMVSDNVSTQKGGWYIWIKNLWATSKRSDETDAQYAERVWRPILGDRTGNEAKVVFSTGWLSTSEDYEFTIVGIPEYDESRSIDGVSSHWKIWLDKCDAEEEATGKLMPSDTLKPVAGDYFFFIGIDMPHEYVVWSEEALDDWKKEELIEKSDISPTWVVSLDKVRIANYGNAGAIIDEIQAGRLFVIKDDKFIDGSHQEVVYISEVKYTYKEPTDTEANLIPDVEITLSNDYEVSANPVSELSSSIDNLSRRLGNISGMVQSFRASGDKTYLRKDRPDSTSYPIALGAGASFGNYIQNLAGAAIDRIGNAEFESITSRSFLKVFELIYNRINAVEGEVDFSDSATVDAISDNADGSRTLYLRKRWEGDFNAFQPGDIVYGYVNNLQASGVYGKAWGVVTSTDKGDNNSITVNPYPGYDCPSGVNIPFAASMVIAKHGNAIEPNADNARLYPEFIVPSASDTSKYINKRQSSFVISAPDGNIRYLHGINSPKANLSHVGMVLGRIPDGLFPQTSAIGQIAADGMPRIYAKGIIAQEILRTDYRGLTIRTQNYRGEWNSLTAKSAEAYYASNDELFDVVTHNGRLWQCYVSGTKDEPCDDASCGWLPMSEAGFNVWSIGSSYDTITKSNDGEYTPARLDVWAILQNGNQCRQIESEDELFGDYGLAIVVDGYEEEATYLDIFTPEDDEGDYFESESDSYDYIRAESVPAVKNGFIDTKYIPDSGITIRLVSTADGTEYARKHISVVSDGADGLNGAQGPMAYPAGEYSADAVYDASKGVSPIVLYSGQYFILKAGQKWEGESVEGGNPAVNSTSDNPKWELVDKFNTIFADIVMANFAKLSHAVFYDRYMFSGFGKRYNGNNNNFDYAHIDEYLNGDEKYSFKPNLLINLQTGEIFADSLTAGNTEFCGKELTSEEVVFPGNAIPVTDASSIPYSEKYTFDKNDGEKTVSGTVEICTFSGLMYKKLRIRANSCSIYCQGFKSSVGQPKCTISAKLELQLYRQGASTPSNTLTSQISTYGYKTLVPKDTWDTDGLFFSDTNRYTLKLHYEISAGFPDPVAGEDVIGSASVNFPGITVEVYDDEKEEYKSIYYNNGFAVGQSSKDYIMAYNDPNNQGMAFIMQNKGGAGISCDSRGLLVKDENTGGNWTSLADYIKQITNSQ